MEPIIGFIAMLILSFLFKGKKKESPEGQPKPFTAQPDSPVRKLKDMSKDMYRELQKEMQRETVEPPSRQLPRAEVNRNPVTPKPAPIEIPVKRDSRSDSSNERHSGRLSAHGGVRRPVQTIDTHNLLPKSEQDLLKGIIFSEIFGPPKSKR